jgi:hypothetical protein
MLQVEASHSQVETESDFVAIKCGFLCRQFLEAGVVERQTGHKHTIQLFGLNGYSSMNGIATIWILIQMCSSIGLRDNCVSSVQNGQSLEITDCIYSGGSAKYITKFCFSE